MQRNNIIARAGISCTAVLCCDMGAWIARAIETWAAEGTLRRPAYGNPLMIRAICQFAVAFLASAAASGALQAQKGGIKAVPPSEDMQKILSWLPADTETIFVANGPFNLPDLSPREFAPGAHAESPDDLKEDFEAIPLSLIGFKNGLLANRLQGQKVLVALEGSRHFRSPTGVGESPFEGCSLALFARDVSDRVGPFLKDSISMGQHSEQIEGQQVVVFNEQMESDVWTILVDSPQPDLVLACTSRDYLRTLLIRMRGARGAMALPDNLPEWKYVDAHARFWAIRHFDKAQAADDPTSPFGGKKSANIPDEQAIGLTFHFDPYKSRDATVIYLSGGTGISKQLRESRLAGGDNPAAAPLDIEFRELSPGVVSVTYYLEDLEGINLFRFILSAMLGHAVYL